MKYRSGYKYQLSEDEVFWTAFHPTNNIDTQFIKLGVDGKLTILSGYAYDGASGPTIDDDVFKYCSLPHDALYQLMRMGLLDSDDWKMADEELKNAAKAKLLMSPWYIKAWWKTRLPIVMLGLKMAGGKYAKEEQRKEVFEI
jgi:hypothetical protein